MSENEKHEAKPAVPGWPTIANIVALVGLAGTIAAGGYYVRDLEVRMDSQADDIGELRMQVGNIPTVEQVKDEIVTDERAVEILREPIPGTVVAFATAGCPEGWAPYEAASGRFIVGNDGREGWEVQTINGRLRFMTGGEEEVTMIKDQMPIHSHASERAMRYYIADNLHSEARGPQMSSGWGFNVLHDGPYPDGSGDSLRLMSDSGGGEPHNNMPPYIALYWCTPTPAEAE